MSKMVALLLRVSFVLVARCFAYAYPKLHISLTLSFDRLLSLNIVAGVVVVAVVVRRVGNMCLWSVLIIVLAAYEFSNMLIAFLFY